MNAAQLILLVLLLLAILLIVGIISVWTLKIHDEVMEIKRKLRDNIDFK